MTYSVNILIKIAIAAILAVIFGNGSVVAFNNIAPKWFEDYEEGGVVGPDGKPRRVLPPKLLEADNAGRQRLPSSPWKYAFVGYFGIVGLYLAVRGGGGAAFEFSVLCMLFVILEMAIADQLYNVVPDQFNIALAVMSIAFISYHEKWWEPIAGAGLGLAISLAILGLGMILFRTGSIGGADIKFFACMGFTAGRSGIVIIYILTTVFFAVYTAVRIACGKATIRSTNPMMPSACAAVTVYFLFLWNMTDLFFTL